MQSNAELSNKTKHFIRFRFSHFIVLQKICKQFFISRESKKKEVTVLCLEGLSNRRDKDIESSC